MVFNRAIEGLPLLVLLLLNESLVSIDEYKLLLGGELCYEQKKYTFYFII